MAAKHGPVFPSETSASPLPQRRQLSYAAAVAGPEHLRLNATDRSAYPDVHGRPQHQPAKPGQPPVAQPTVAAHPPQAGQPPGQPPTRQRPAMLPGQTWSISGVAEALKIPPSFKAFASAVDGDGSGGGGGAASAGVEGRSAAAAALGVSGSSSSTSISSNIRRGYGGGGGPGTCNVSRLVGSEPTAIGSQPLSHGPQPNGHVISAAALGPGSLAPYGLYSPYSGGGQVPEPATGTTSPLPYANLPGGGPLHEPAPGGPGVATQAQGTAPGACPEGLVSAEVMVGPTVADQVAGTAPLFPGPPTAAAAHPQQPQHQPQWHPQPYALPYPYPQPYYAWQAPYISPYHSYPMLPYPGPGCQPPVFAWGPPGAPGAHGPHPGVIAPSVPPQPPAAQQIAPMAALPLGAPPPYWYGYSPEPLHFPGPPPPPPPGQLWGPPISVSREGTGMQVPTIPGSAPYSTYPDQPPPHGATAMADAVRAATPPPLPSKAAPLPPSRPVAPATIAADTALRTAIRRAAPVHPAASAGDSLAAERPSDPAAAGSKTRGGDAAGQEPSTVVPCTAPTAVREWVLSGGLDKLQVAALEAPGGVLREHQGVALVSEDVNFGVRAIVEDPPAAARSPLKAVADVAAVAAAAQTQQQQQQQQRQQPVEEGLRGASPQGSAPVGVGAEAATDSVRASLRLVNRGQEAVVLVNVRAMPQYSHCLRLQDEAGVAVQDPVRAARHRSQVPSHANGSSPAVGGMPAVLLPPGAEYSVDVVLSLNKANFANRRAERGLLGQLVLFTFLFRPPHGRVDATHGSRGVASLGALGAAAAGGHGKDVGREAASRGARARGAAVLQADVGAWSAAVVGGRVAVAVVDRRRLMEVNSMLKATAPPFIPKVFRQLFSTPPSRVLSHSTTLGQALFSFEHARSVVTPATAAASPVTLALRALIIATSELPPPPPPPSSPSSPRRATRSSGPFGQVPPALLSAVSGVARPAAAPAAAAGVVPALSAATTMDWASKSGVGRSAMERLEELSQCLAAAAGDANDGDISGLAFGSVTVRSAAVAAAASAGLYGSFGHATRRVDASQTTWGKQLLSHRAPQETRRALEDMYEAAIASTAAAADASAAASPPGPTAAAAAAAYQRSELLRYGKLLVEEEDVMEHDIRTFNLYNARVRAALFGENMLTYRVLNWPPFAQPPPSQTAPPATQQSAQTTALQPGEPQQQQQQSPAGAVSELQEGADVAPAVPRPYRGPRLQSLCTVTLEPEATAAAVANGSSEKSSKKSAAKAQSATAGVSRQELLLAAVVEVPGLVEDRPRLVAGDLVFVRLEAQRQVEYVAQLLTVDAGQMLLVMPPEYWQDLRALARTQSAPSGVPASGSGLGSGSGRAVAAAAVPPVQAAPLAHCCFSFDRTPFVRMHEALLRATLRPQQLLLPPPPAPPAVRKAGLPDLPDDLYNYQLPVRHHNHHPHHNNWHDTIGYGGGGDQDGLGGSPSDADLAEVAARLRLVGGTALNPEQRLACAAMLCGAGRDFPFVLFGPPGTGKTVTLVECALQILAAEGPPPAPFLPGGGGRRQRSARLLLAAPQNYSADLITSSLAAALGSLAGGGRLLRLNDPRRRVVEAKADVLPYCLIDDSTAAFRLPNPKEVQLAQVVVCSCSSAGILHEGSFLREALMAGARRAAAAGGGSSSSNNSNSINNGSSCLEFTHVLVDEAGQALLPEVLIPLTLRAAGGAAMLCGDPRQLEPVVRSAAAARGGLATSLLELLMESARKEGHLDRAREAAGLAERLLHTGAPQPHLKPQQTPTPTQSQTHVRRDQPVLHNGSSNGRSHQHQQQAAACGAATAAAGAAPPPPPPLRGVMLVRNYRSAAPLLDLPSRLFYDQQLKACVDATSSRAPDWDLLVLPSASAAPTTRAAPTQSTSTSIPAAAAASAPDPSTSDGNAAASAVSTDSGVGASTGLGVVRTPEGDEAVPAGGAAAVTPAAAVVDPPSGGAVAAAAAASSWDDGMEIVAPAHLLFFGVRGQQHQELDAPSYFNPLEAATVADLVDSLIKASWAAATQRLEAQRQRRGGGGGPGEGVLSGVVNQHDIGIICTYRKQVFKLRQLLRDRGLGGVRVGTVDDYQGQEERIIFISTVLSNVDSLPGVALNGGDGGGSGYTDSLLPPQHPLGLWSHPRRFNVAVTRCRALLVVVGHPAVLLADRYWRELVRQCVARGMYRGAGEALVRRRMRQEGARDGGRGSWWRQSAGAVSRRAADADAGVSAGDEVAAAAASTANASASADDVVTDGGNGADGAATACDDEYDDEEYGNGAESETWEDDDEGDEPDAADLAVVVQQLAEMATLGMGCEDEIYPDLSDLHSFYEQQSAYFEEMPFRVQL